MEILKHEVRGGVCRVEEAVSALSEEKTDMRGALNFEKAERKQDNVALGNRIESKVVREGNKIEEALNVM